MYRTFRHIQISLTQTAVAALLILSGCQSSPGTTGPAGSDSSEDSLPSAPAIVQAPAQLPPSQVDTTAWSQSNGTISGINYSYRYPVGWTAELTYCAPGAAEAGRGDQHLPKGCVSTDFLAGQKARDVGRIAGNVLDVHGKRGMRLVDSSPQNVLVSRIYTLMVYGDDGGPMFGFVTIIGPDTDAKMQDDVITKLDAVAATLQVGK